MNASLPDKIPGDILIVDNEPESLQGLSDILVPRGYEVRDAGNGAAALDVLHNHPPDLLLMDVSLPDVDGYDVCKRLKADPCYGGLPVVLMIAPQAADERGRVFETGAVDFITKPFQVEEVLARIRMHLSLRRLNEKLEHEVERRTAAFKESEMRYRSIIEASPVSIFGILDGRFVSVNPAGCLMLGFSRPEEMIGMPAMRVVATESQTFIAGRLNRLAHGIHNPLAEAILLRKDGKEITVESSSVSVLMDGTTTAMVFAQDISRRKQMGTQLRDSEARLNAFMDHYPAIIYIKDKNLRHVYANKYLLDSFGETPEGFIGTTTHDFFPSDVARSIEKEDRAVLVGKKLKAREIKRKSQGGNYRWYNDLKFPIQLDAGESLIGGISTDITERKCAEEKIEELRRFEQLLSDISTSFIDVPIEKIDRYIHDVLEQIGRFLGFDRCSLGNVTPDHKKMIVTHVWNRGTVSGVRQSYTIEQYPWLLSPFTTGNKLLWNKSMGLPDGSEADIRLLEESGMQSFAGIPVTVAGEIKACLGFSSVSEQKYWEPELYNRLNHLSRIFGNALSRKQADEDLQMMQFSIDNSMDRIAWIAPDGRFLYANEAACKEMHYTREQVLSMGVPDFDPGFPQEKWDKHFQNLKKVGSMRLEAQQVDARGEMHHLDITSNYYNFNGTEFICSFARDITDLRQIEQNLREQLAFEDLLSQLSATFIHIKASEIDHTIERGLGLVTAFLDIQRSNLFQFSKDNSELRLTHSFAVQGVEPSPKTLYSDQQPWFTSRLLSGETFSFASIAELPEEVGAETAYLKQARIRSAVVLPLMAAGVSHGAITLSSLKTERQWSPKLIQQLELLTEIFSNALMRKRAHDIIQHRLDVERLLTRLATGFINLSVDGTERYLEQAMQQISEQFNADRASILQFNADMSELRRTHMWERDGIDPDPYGKAIRVNDRFPGIYERLRNGETILIRDTDSVTDHGLSEYCQTIGIRSFVMLPLIVGKTNWGAIVFSFIFSETSLSDDQVTQLQLYSTIIANALARQRTAQTLEKSRQNAQMLAGRLLTIQESERKRLARELHDDLSQRLAVLAMSASRVRADLEPLSTEAADSIQAMHRQLVKISEDVHAISRQLHPSILEDLGLVDAVRNEINAFRRREGIHVDYRVADVPGNLPRDIALCFFRIIQEGLRNIARHARADAGAIHLFGKPDRLAMVISDQGCGFDMQNSQDTTGLGLISMRERVKMISGRLAIASSPGNGTRIEVFAPIQASDSSWTME